MVGDAAISGADRSGPSAQAGRSPRPEVALRLPARRRGPVSVTTASALALALALRYGYQRASVGGQNPSALTGVFYVTVAALTAPAWVAVLAASRT